jgi:hypothetical protein
MRTRCLFLLLGVLTMHSGLAIAQSDIRSAYLTKPVRVVFSNVMAERIATIAPQVGFNTIETRALAEGIRNGSLTFIRPQGDFVAGNIVAQTATDRVEFRTPIQVDTIQQALNVSTYRPLLQKYATVRLEVKPVPPRDYKVEINGEDCPATVQGLYVVPPGTTAVKASRIGKTDCVWSGVIPGGDEHVVQCQL